MPKTGVNGVVFLANYFRENPDADSIQTIPSSVATAFFEKYGTEHEKGLRPNEIEDSE